ncbi:hypothetical protein LDENG_00127920, partial [Lucifuga dentata]
MADGQQPEDHWASNGQENGENGYSTYSSAYRENGYHGGVAMQPGAAVDESANLPPSPPPSPSAEQIGPVAEEEKVEVVTASSAEEQQEDEEEAPQEGVTHEQPGDMLLKQTDLITEPQALGPQQAQTAEVLNGGNHQASIKYSPSQEAQPEECTNKPSCEPSMKEDEPQTHRSLLMERPKPEGEEPVSTGSSSPSVKEKELSISSLSHQQSHQEVEEDPESCRLVESKTVAAKQPSLTEQCSQLTGEDKERNISPSKSTTENQNSGSEIRSHEISFLTDMNKPDQRQETAKSSLESGIDSKPTSDISAGHESGMKTYFETFSQSRKQEAPQTQSYYELSTITETKLSEQDFKVESSHQNPDKLSSTVASESIMQKIEDVEEKVSSVKTSLEQKNLSLNIGSLSDQTTKGGKSQTVTEILCPISGSFDDSSANPSTPSGFSPMLFNTPTKFPEDIPTKAETPLPSTKHSSSFEESSSLSEMLDLAGALPRPPLERRDVDMRRKSVPTNVSALVGNSLVKLALGEQTSRVVSGESQLEEVGYCVFNEYSGPMPSPADLPTAGDSPHQQLPAMEDESEEEPGGTKAVMQQPDPKEIVHEMSQKTVAERKDVLGSPIKSMMLERAVTTGMKPDRLRIPMTSSKDRLAEFRLESGLPGNIKIQAIPEVEVEKDPSREASPIPLDNSFTFTENGSKAPQIPTTPKSPGGASTWPQVTGEEIKNNVKAEKDLDPEIIDDKQKKSFDKEMPRCDQSRDDNRLVTGAEMASASSEPLEESIEKDSTRIQSDHGTTQPSEESDMHETKKDVKHLTIDTPLDEKECTLEKGSTKPPISSPVIIIPQAHVEEDAEEEDDIEIAEEPQEIMGEAEEFVLQAEDRHFKDMMKEELRMTECVHLTVDEPKSADESSHSAQISDDGEPATDSSHLSACSDHELPHMTTEGDADVKTGKDGVEDEEVGGSEEKDGGNVDEEDKACKVGEEVEEISQSSQAAQDETTMDASILDTDSVWMDSQDDDKSVMTEQIEALPQTQSPTRTPVVDKPAKRAPGRGKGTTESKASHKVPSHHLREEKKKKKGVRRADPNKASVLQSRSPSRKSVAKAAARHPRPALLHGSARRKATGVESHHPLNVAHESRTTVSTFTHTHADTQ